MIIKNDKYALYKGDCLEVMDKLISEGVKVDAIITDPPYGTIACKWDSVIPFDKMWERLNKLIKPNGAICLFGSEPFSSNLRMSNIKNYKYDWYWNKVNGGVFATAKYRPLSAIEQIMVFSKNGKKYFTIQLWNWPKKKIKGQETSLIREKKIVLRVCLVENSSIKKHMTKIKDTLKMY